MGAAPRQQQREHAPEDVALELVAEHVAINLLGHALVVHGGQLLLIVDVEGLHRPRGGVGDVQLQDARAGR
jgi:hypothetical protein